MKKKVTNKIPRKPKVNDDNPMIQREERISRCEVIDAKNW